MTLWSTGENPLMPKTHEYYTWVHGCVTCSFFFLEALIHYNIGHASSLNEENDDDDELEITSEFEEDDYDEEEEEAFEEYEEEETGEGSMPDDVPIVISPPRSSLSLFSQQIFLSTNLISLPCTPGKAGDATGCKNCIAGQYQNLTFQLVS